ncbi:P27 family phage terminase small subunit [Bradyrhizobium sp. 170]|uniref:P27 family phage terminase small subunit n=1 Tax=Bradyrhizobium sp. 170 TaxID=2782641 RepID=UPI0021114B0C|nr:P27 family phage terminase small subunit [Bradyrhizobium sp. 170]
MRGRKPNITALPGALDRPPPAPARIRECEAVIQKQGLTYVSPTGESKRRPESTLAKENIEVARRLAAELGITPASRSKNKGGATEDDNEDEFGVDI